MHRTAIFCLIIFSIWASACKTAKQPARPMERYDELFEERTSAINIPVRISVKEIEQSINKQLQGVIYEDRDFSDGDNMMVKAQKKEDITLSMDNQSIKYRVPVSLWIKYDTGLGKVEADGEIALSFRTTFAINPDWSLSTVTDVENYQWLRQPRLKMGAVSLPVGFIANLVLNRSKKAISKSIDELVSESFRMEELIADAWRQMQYPILVSEEYNTWLTVNPQRMGMTPLSVVNDEAQSTIFVESKPIVNLGQMPARKAILAPLPPFAYSPELDQNFSIHLDADIPFKEAERIARTELVGETFSQGKRSVKIENVELYGQGENIVVNTTLSGSYYGHIYLVGKPVFNPARNAVDLQNLKFTLETENFLYKSAAWLLKSTIRKKIQDNLNFMLDYNLVEIRNQARQQLENYRITEGIRLKGHLEGLNISNAYLTQESIIVRVAIVGNLEVHVSGLE
jgi:hypothetical protein